MKKFLGLLFGLMFVVLSGAANAQFRMPSNPEKYQGEKCGQYACIISEGESYVYDSKNKGRVVFTKDQCQKAPEHVKLPNPLSTAIFVGCQNKGGEAYFISINGVLLSASPDPEKAKELAVRAIEAMVPKKIWN